MSWLHHLYDVVGGSVLICSTLHTVLPPWDWLDDFPRAQKYYKAFIYLVGYVAISGRSTVYRSISVHNPERKG